MDARKGMSTLGQCSFFMGNLIDWKSSCSTRVAESSAEAETMAVVLWARENAWLRNLIFDIWDIEIPIPTPLLNSNKDFTILVGEDNAAAISMSEGKQSSKTKYFSRDWYKVVDRIKSGEFELIKVPTEDNRADFFTKALKTPRFQFLKEKIMGPTHLQSHFSKPAKEVNLTFVCEPKSGAEFGGCVFMTTGSYTKDISYTHSLAVMPPKPGAKLEDAKQLLDAFSAQAPTFKLWSTDAATSIAAIEAMNQAVEVLGPEILGDEGITLLEKAQAARVTLTSGLNDTLPKFSVVAQRLANWAASIASQPAPTQGLNQELQTLKAEVSELKTQLDTEKREREILRADLKRKATDHDLRKTALRKIRKLALEIGYSFGSLSFTDSDPDSDDEIAEPLAEKIDQASAHRRTPGAMVPSRRMDASQAQNGTRPKLDQAQIGTGSKLDQAQNGTGPKLGPAQSGSNSGKAPSMPKPSQDQIGTQPNLDKGSSKSDSKKTLSKTKAKPDSEKNKAKAKPDPVTAKVGTVQDSEKEVKLDKTVDGNLKTEFVVHLQTDTGGKEDYFVAQFLDKTVQVLPSSSIIFLSNGKPETTAVSNRRDEGAKIPRGTPKIDSTLVTSAIKAQEANKAKLEKAAQAKLEKAKPKAKAFRKSSGKGDSKGAGKGDQSKGAQGGGKGKGKSKKKQ